MCSSTRKETKLVDTYEGILRRRAELLELMEERRQRREEQRGRQQEASRVAHRRNELLLQDLQRLEEEVKGQRLPRPHLLALDNEYWASVADAALAWERSHLGEGQVPTDGPEPSPRRAKQKPSTAQDHRLPPRPKPRAPP